MKYIFDVKNFDGELAVFLLQSGISSRQITRLRKQPGLIRCNGQTVFSNAKVKDGDVIEIDVHEKADVSVPVCDKKVDIVYQDEHFCVIDKPAGMAVIATKRYYGASLQNVLANEWGDKFVFHPVNRLDKDTSGLMIVAKNSYVHNLFDKMLAQNNIKKSYVAVVDGILQNDGTIDAPILDVAGQIKRVVDDKGKTAFTQYKIKKVFDKKTLVDINLLTGRTHQIRVHFSHIGFPLVGDEIYGKKSELISRHALHAVRLQFVHPVTNENMVFSSPLPDDIKQLFGE